MVQHWDTEPLQIELVTKPFQNDVDRCQMPPTPEYNPSDRSYAQQEEAMATWVAWLMQTGDGMPVGRYIWFPKVSIMLWTHQVFCFGVSHLCCVTKHLYPTCKMPFRFHPFQVLKPHPKTVLTHRHWQTIGALVLKLPEGCLRLWPNMEYILFYTWHCPDVFEQMIGNYGTDVFPLTCSQIQCSPAAPYDMRISAPKSFLLQMVGSVLAQWRRNWRHMKHCLYCFKGKEFLWQ